MHTPVPVLILADDPYKQGFEQVFPKKSSESERAPERIGVEIEIRPTDTFFFDSPDAGDPTCTCSRCKSPITEGPVIRALATKPGEHGYVDMPGKTEFRFCWNCMEDAGFKTIK